MSNKAARTAELERAARELCESKGFEYVDTELVKEPGGRFLRIYIDKPGGITLDELEDFHKLIRGKADDIDYDYMEVSSPGADRPLKTPRDFEKATGKRVELKLYAPLDGQKQFLGELETFDAASVTIGINGESRTFEMKSIALIRLYPDIDSELSENT